MVTAMLTHNDMAKPVRQTPPSCSATHPAGPARPRASTA